MGRDGLSLFLSFGVGLAGGGIQHFEQFSQRCAIMTPLGLTMYYVAFVAKDPEAHWRTFFGRFTAGFAVVVVAVWLGMSALASTIDSTGHDHDHGTNSNTPAAQPSEPTDHSTPEPVGEHAKRIPAATR